MFRNLIDPFSASAWISLGASVAAIVVAFLAIRKTYIALEDFQPEEEERVGLIKENTTGLDILFKVLSVLTEPAKIDYFPRFSAGT